MEQKPRLDKWLFNINEVNVPLNENKLGWLQEDSPKLLGWILMKFFHW